MVIDFHTHVFPESIAAVTIKKLEVAGSVNAFTNGTLCGLISSMRECAVDISVVLPVVTRPSQFETVNHYAKQITGKDGIISFGGVHPDSKDYKEELEQIKRMGLQGIKLHPDYQNTFINDVKMIRLIQYAVEIGLIVVIHAGIDIGLPDPVHCTPKLTNDMLCHINKGEGKIVLAHMGGYDMWDDVEKYLVGKEIWFDTSYSLTKMGEEQFLRIVKNHGSDRILFGTDSPWDGQKEGLATINKLDITKEQRTRILGGNAMQLLGLKYR